MTEDRFPVLWTAFLEGELDADGMAELDRLLDSEPGRARRAADLYEEHRLLCLAMGREEPGAFARDLRSKLASDRDRFVKGVTEQLRNPIQPAPRRWVGYVLAMAATLLVSFVFQALLVKAARTPVPAEYVATLIRTKDASWTSGAPAAGQRLPEGELHLEKGVAVIRFDSGAALAMEGPASLELLSRGRARLIRGNVTAHVPEEAIGFTLRTPANEVVDLGTEFSVKVEPSGATEVHVLEGEVAWSSLSAQAEPAILTQGNAIRIDRPGESTARALPASGPRFETLLERSRPDSGLYVHEPFDYPAPEMTCAQANGGTGWRGPWRLRQGDEIRHTKDIYTGMRMGPMPSHPDSTALHLADRSTYRIREFDRAIDMDRDGVVYISFMTHRKSHPNPATPPRNSAFRVTFRSVHDYWGPVLGFALERHGRPIFSLGPGQNFSSPALIPRDETLLWVGKVVSRKEGKDRVFLRIYNADEPVDLLEPALWTVTTDPFDSRARHDLIIVTGGGALEQWMDEFRIGSTWEAVTSR